MEGETEEVWCAKKDMKQMKEGRKEKKKKEDNMLPYRCGGTAAKP